MFMFSIHCGGESPIVSIWVSFSFILTQHLRDSFDFVSFSQQKAKTLVAFFIMYIYCICYEHFEATAITIFSSQFPWLQVLFLSIVQ